MSVRLAEEVDEAELRAQLDHARSLRFTNRELIWLGGNTFYGVKSIFSPDFLARLADYRLPDYDLSRGADGWRLIAHHTSSAAEGNAEASEASTHTLH